MRRSVVAGAMGGVFAFAVLAVVAAVLMRRLMPAMMPRMMKRMMADGGCSDEMRACMEKCGRLPDG
jgi:hypothetical protein